MEIREKLEVIVEKDDKKYYCYGPDIRVNEIDQLWDAGNFCWLMTKPVSQADIADVVECVDCIKVWFSDFQIYKHLLRKMYGYEIFNDLCEKRWEFLDSNKNRFHLLYTYIVDYGMAFDEYETICFDNLKQEYIYILLKANKSCFEIRKLVSNENDLNNIYEEIKEAKVFECNSITIKEEVSYTLENKEYEPLLKLFLFLRSFYAYYIVDGDLITNYLPKDPQEKCIKND